MDTKGWANLIERNNKKNGERKSLKVFSQIYYYLYLWAVGAGGVLWDLGGHKGITFTLILGHKTSNEAKSLSMYEILTLFKNQNNSKVKFIGDSRIRIPSMITKKYLTNPLLNFYHKKEMFLFYSFRRVEFLHILHSLNSIVDQNSKEIASHCQGHLQKKSFFWGPLICISGSH